MRMYTKPVDIDRQNKMRARIYKLGRHASIEDLRLVHDALDAIVRNHGTMCDEVRNAEVWERATS